MNFPPADWFPIRAVLAGLAEDERENRKNIQSTNLLDPERIEAFISEVDKEIGRD